MKVFDSVKVSAMVIKAMEMARSAAQVQMEYFRSGHLDVCIKQGEADIVTKADRESEKIITQSIAVHYPDHNILSEEGVCVEHDSDWTWVIDPLDGTTNYTAGLPLFAVSIGIRYKDETVGGVVYAPCTDEMFSAIKGVGSFLNGKRLHVRDNDRMDRAVVATGFPVDKDTNPDNNLDNLSRVLPKVRGVRRLGAAAIDLCYVAAGILDAYWELNLHPWDVCAGRLMVLEAGGRVELFREDRGISIVAASEGIFDALRENIQ